MWQGTTECEQHSLIYREKVNITLNNNQIMEIHKDAYKELIPKKLQDEKEMSEIDIKNWILKETPYRWMKTAFNTLLRNTEIVLTNGKYCLPGPTDSLVVLDKENTNNIPMKKGKRNVKTSNKVSGGITKPKASGITKTKKTANSAQRQKKIEKAQKKSTEKSKKSDPETSKGDMDVDA